MLFVVYEVASVAFSSVYFDKDVLFVFFKVAGVARIFINYNTVAMLFVVYPVASVDVKRWGIVNTVAMSFVVFPVAGIAAAIETFAAITVILHYALTLSLAVFHLAFI